MRSPITFKEWLSIVGIVFLICVSFLLFEQLPFINNFLDTIRDYIDLQSEYIY